MYNGYAKTGDEIYVTNPINICYRMYGIVTNGATEDSPNIEARFEFPEGYAITTVLRRKEYWIIGKDTY